MKSLVIFKLSRNPQDARISGDRVDWKGVRLSPSDDDHAAMSVARQIANGDEVIAVTIGDGDTAWAAARGASRTILVGDVPMEAEDALVGQVMAAVFRKVGDVGAVVMGDSAWDYGLGAAIAGYLGIPAIAGVTSATAEGETLRIVRKVGALAQTIEVKAPAQLCVTATGAEKQPPGMKDVLAARKKPVERLSMSDLGISAKNGCQSLGTRLPDTPPAKIIDGANPVAACEQLLAALRADGVI